MLFGINSTSNVIEIAQSEAECYSIALRVLVTPNCTGYPCYHSLIVGQLFKKSFALVTTLYVSLITSLFQD